MHACPDTLAPKTAFPVWLSLPALLMAAFALIAAAAPAPTAVLTSAPATDLAVRTAQASFAPLALQPAPQPAPLPAPVETIAPEAPPPELALIIPVADVAGGDLDDTWGAARSAGRRHKGIDIMAPSGRPVLAAADGVIVRMVSNALGGRTIYQRDAGGAFILYYAHLDGYAPGLEAGASVRQGDVIGFVGTTGNATTPHLHFEVMRQPDQRRSWGGRSLNPYTVLMNRPIEQPDGQPAEKT
ncbi:MAG: metalloendopeptidase [Alphaproteobacteria bacterium]|nr:MAG: metalloendopeptidase [Caulobacteraceae bacterium]TPW08572.1 MAG: metalloendopeptidase [Alphaproteobacteria bacterium]